MRNYTFTKQGVTFQRVNKRQAQTAYDNSLSVIVCACNLRPGYPWYPETEISKRNGGYSFETVLHQWAMYGCLNSETGKYPSFYIPVKEVDRFTGETPTAETMGTVKQYDYKYMGIDG